MPEGMTGKTAPNFDLPTDGGGRVKLSDFAGQKVVLYFYPKDDTSGCTLEAIDFTKASRAFAKAGTAVIGISPDTEKSHDKFKTKHKLGITLASDPDHKAIEPYGVWVREEHVRPQVHGRRAGDVPDRPRSAHRSRNGGKSGFPATSRQCWKPRRRSRRLSKTAQIEGFVNLNLV